MLGAFSIAYAIFEIPTGFMGDRIGPRRTITRIVMWWSVFTVLTGYARTFWHLIATRFLFGAGEAGAYPNASIAIARWFPTWERARAQGYLARHERAYAQELVPEHRDLRARGGGAPLSGTRAGGPSQPRRRLK